VFIKSLYNRTHRVLACKSTDMQNFKKQMKYALGQWRSNSKQGKIHLKRDLNVHLENKGNMSIQGKEYI